MLSTEPIYLVSGSGCWFCIANKLLPLGQLIHITVATVIIERSVILEGLSAVTACPYFGA